MDRCIESLMAHPEDVEVIIVDDGSTDETPGKADSWHERYPDTIRVIHQENRGHGGAVNTGLAAANGLYFKVIDSDDWLDPDAVNSMLMVLRRYRGLKVLDLLVCNYVYEHVHDGTRHVMEYRRCFPKGKVFDWSDAKTLSDQTPLLMHSVIYRTQVLRDCGLKLPEHTFYVDNIFVYVPLPHCDRIYYLDVDLYHYYIGREDQSVNEQVMISRIDQQLAITRYMIDAVKIPEDIPYKKLERYMVGYLTLMMAICSVFTLMSDRPDKTKLRDGIWHYLKDADPGLYRRIRRTFIGIGSNLHGKAGNKATILGYRIAQRIFKFN